MSRLMMLVPLKLSWVYFGLFLELCHRAVLAVFDAGAFKKKKFIIFFFCFPFPFSEKSSEMSLRHTARRLNINRERAALH